MIELPSLRDTIRDFGLSAEKKLGQHFLLDPAILNKIAEHAAIGPQDRVLEIGPGPGGLTRALLSRGAKVIAVERDPRCVAALSPLKEAYSDQLRLIGADALKVNAFELFEGKPFKIVANLPYNIGTELLVRWLTASAPLVSIHVLLQKEVVLRLIARPSTKPYGRLAVLTQLTSEPEALFDLPPGAFHPPPKVVSSLARLIPKPGKPCCEILGVLAQLTQMTFSQRRKMLRSSLRGLPLSPEQLLDPLEISSEVRPETLAPGSFLQMARKIHDLRSSTQTRERNA